MQLLAQLVGGPPRAARWRYIRLIQSFDDRRELILPRVQRSSSVRRTASPVFAVISHRALRCGIAVTPAARSARQYERGQGQVNHLIETSAARPVLRRIASTIMTTVRTNDLVFRFGGEEFVVICDGMAADPALALGERIRREVAGSEDGASQVTVSVGIASGGPDAADYDGMFALADRRLYQAKAAGRNCVIGERVASVQTPVRLVHAS